MPADLHVLCAGYAHDRVASTVVLIQDGGRHVVIDPGMVSDRSKILDPLASLAVDPAEVGDVVFSHHHPDHTLNAALFEGHGSTTSGRSMRRTPGPTGRPTASSSRPR